MNLIMKSLMSFLLVLPLFILNAAPATALDNGDVVNCLSDDRLLRLEVQIESKHGATYGASAKIYNLENKSYKLARSYSAKNLKLILNDIGNYQVEMFLLSDLEITDRLEFFSSIDFGGTIYGSHNFKNVETPLYCTLM